MKETTYPDCFITASEESTGKLVTLATSAVVQHSLLSVTTSNTIYHQLDCMMQALQETLILRASREIDPLWTTIAP